HDAVKSELLAAFLSSGHALIEGVPGLGKTLLVRTLADAVRVKFSRIQFTPDLMPADIVGTNVVHEDDAGNRSFRFEPGPVFGNIILADEINRATPKTQSALLEAMQEQSVTVGHTIHKLDAPFMVIATQNPIEMEGTYPLPEAQLDRFLLKVFVRSSSLDELVEIVDRTTVKETPRAESVASSGDVLAMRELVREVPVASHVKEHIARLVLATHPDTDDAPDVVTRYVRYGSSPRGAQAVTLAAKVRALVEGRNNVAFDDVRAVVHAALRHRIIFNFEGEAEGVTPDAVIDEVLKHVKM
ncbi:MAG TPA: AAA family ATPase, partial [Planctomycetota bacterium]|nr:AAA family ATPase [Planctomycetota bacterium]